MGRGLHDAPANHRDTPRLARKPGSRGNPLRIAGNMSHEWLREKGRPLQRDRDRPRSERGPVKTLEKEHPPPDGLRPMPGNAQSTAEKPRIG